MARKAETFFASRELDYARKIGRFRGFKNEMGVVLSIDIILSLCEMKPLTYQYTCAMLSALAAQNHIARVHLMYDQTLMHLFL